ncbi:MAG: hypothetical protein A2623_11380 [Caulobacterales bacterium RIFCSPHIGHO2_01_FULL_70_19]|nr:MAG: hypothetical protein A2623_11380 [Caulobacterales bacterium RIFCSPHIGHO2_01_FULL_70_19]
MRKLLALALIAISALYYFGLLAGAATYPGYSHITNYASELGAADAPYPLLFNLSIILAGASAIIGALTLPAAFKDLGARRAWAVAAAVALALWGASMIMGGLFPMPDERHGAFGLGLVAPLIPLFVLLALGSVKAAGAMRLFLGLVFAGSVVMLAIMFGVGELVTQANVGLYQRLNSGISILWFALFGLWLLTRGRKAAR